MKYQKIEISAELLATIQSRGELVKTEAMLPALQAHEERLYVDIKGSCITCMQDIESAQWPVQVYRALRASRAQGVNFHSLNDPDKHREIIRITCGYFNEAEPQVLSKSRQSYLVRVRMYIYRLSSLYTNLSLSQMGRYTGQFNHATVLHQLTRAELMQDHPGFIKNINNLHEKLHERGLMQLRDHRIKNDYPNTYIRQISNAI